MATERQLIDLNDVFPNKTFTLVTGDPWKTLDKLINRLTNAPVIDAVEVVRCKDCNHVSICNCISCLRGVSVYCVKYGKHMMMDGFCSYGERRNDK